MFAGNVTTIDADSLSRFIKKNLSNLKNGITIVEFWTTWCLPCQKQSSVLSGLYAKYNSKGLSIIGVSLDYNKKKVGKFINKQRINYPVYLGNEEMAFSYGVKALPTTHIYDKDGNLLKKHVGYTKEDEFKKTIENILNPARISKK